MVCSQQICGCNKLGYLLVQKKISASLRARNLEKMSEEIRPRGSKYRSVVCFDIWLSLFTGKCRAMGS
jgi:hypothetical protein